MSISNYGLTDMWTMILIAVYFVVIFIFLYLIDYMATELEEKESLEADGVTIGHCCGEHPTCHHEKFGKLMIDAEKSVLPKNRQQLEGINNESIILYNNRS